MNSPSRRKFDPNNLTLRDIAIIIPIVFAILIVFILFRSFVSHETYIKWGGLALNTGILFGFLGYYSRAYFRQGRFWFLIVSLLGAHLAIFIIVLTHVNEWGLAWFWLTDLIEATAFLGLRQWLL